MLFGLRLLDIFDQPNTEWNLKSIAADVWNDHRFSLSQEACSEISVSSALLCSNLLKTVNSFGFDNERRKELHVHVQTPPSFPTQKKKKGKKMKWRAHLEACEWEVVGDRLAPVSGIWSGSAVGIFSHGECAAAASNPSPRHICWGTTLD